MTGIVGMSHGHRAEYDYVNRLWKCTCGEPLFNNNGEASRSQRQARTEGMVNHRKQLKEVTHG